MASKHEIVKICSFLSLGHPLYLFPLKKTGLSYPAWRLVTKKNIYFLKEYPAEQKKQLEQSLLIAKKFSHQYIPTLLPILQEQNSIFLIYPWQSGKHYFNNEIYAAQIQQVALLLHRLHQINLFLPDAKAVLNEDIDTTLLMSLGHLAMKVWCQNFFDAVYMLKRDLIISHGDLLPANIIWQTPTMPIIIDWDNAGWINRHIDLFNTAINWAGVESDKFDWGRYHLFLDTYQQASKQPVCINREIIFASFGSWLHWICFNQRRSRNVSFAKNQIKIALRALGFLSTHLVALTR